MSPCEAFAHAQARQLERAEKRQAIESNLMIMNQRFPLNQQMPLVNREASQYGAVTPLPKQPGCGCTGNVEHLLGYENPIERYIFVSATKKKKVLCNLFNVKHFRTALSIRSILMMEIWSELRLAKN